MTMPLSFRLVSLLTWLMATSVCSAQVMDLLKAYEAAVVHDPVHRSALAARDAGREEATIGKAQLLPSISAVVSTDRNRQWARERETLLSSGTFGSASNSSSSTDTNSSTSTATGASRSESHTSSVRTQSESSTSTGALDSFSDEVLSQSDRVRTSAGSLRLRQPLVDFGRFAGYRQGLALSAASESTYRAQAQELMVRVAETYAAVLFAQESRRLAQSQLDTLNVQQRMNERMLEGGEGTITDVLETRAKRELSLAQLIEAEDELTVSVQRLASITGQQVTELAPLRTDLSLVTPPQMDEWRALALEQNGELQALRHQVDAAQEELRRIQSGHLPTLDLTLSIGKDVVESRPLSSQTLNTASTQNSSGSTDSSSTTSGSTTSGGSSTTSSSNTTSQAQSTGQSASSNTSINQKRDYNRRSNTNHRIGLELNIPLFAGGGISAKARQAAARLTQAQAQADARTEEVLLEIQRQLRLQQSAAQRARALEQAVASSRVSVEATIKSMTAGVRTNLDVINARERLTIAERELLSARYSHLLAFLRLRFQAGALAETHLMQVAGIEARSP
jgi:outer membrane protein, protease secretion system